jgi:hypothetical protein
MIKIFKVNEVNIRKNGEMGKWGNYELRITNYE